MNLISDMVIPTEKDTFAIENISKAAIIAHRALVFAESITMAGIRASFIDKEVEKFIFSNGGYPANLEVEGYGYSICVSKGDEIVHGPPRPQKILFFGDLVCIDVGVKYNGYYADCAVSFVVGGRKSHINRIPYKMIRACKIALENSIGILKPGVLLSNYGRRVSFIVERAGFSVLKLLTGHSIGCHYHEMPKIYNFYHSSNDIILKENMVFAFELMITNGSDQCQKELDGWTLSTTDGSMAAHFEHTVLITENGTKILNTDFR